MCSVCFNRNAVICPHVIKIKYVLLSDLGVCRTILMRMKPQFQEKKKIILLLLLENKRKSSLWQIVGVDNYRDHFGMGYNHQKKYMRLFCNLFHCGFCESLTFLDAWELGEGV